MKRKQQQTGVLAERGPYTTRSKKQTYGCHLHSLSIKQHTTHVEERGACPIIAKDNGIKVCIRRQVSLGS